MEINKIRDLTIIKIDKDKSLVVACDSCGSIGMKERDVLKIPTIYVGRFAVRVPILEVICTGAKVISVIDAVCCEMEPTGREVIEGIKQELKSANIEEVALTGSTEENFTSFSTGIGITVIGIVSQDEIKVNKVYEEAQVIAIGIPKVGAEINIYGDEDIVDYETVKTLLIQEEVYEIVPVGSKGIRYEAKQLASSNKKQFIEMKEITVDLDKTAGPSTVVIAAIKKGSISRFNYIRNVNLIGELK